MIGRPTCTIVRCKAGVVDPAEASVATAVSHLSVTAQYICNFVRSQRSCRETRDHIWIWACRAGWMRSSRAWCDRRATSDRRGGGCPTPRWRHSSRTRRTSSRQSASAASPRRSSGVISGTSPNRPRRCGFFAATIADSGGRSTEVGFLRSV